MTALKLYEKLGEIIKANPKAADHQIVVKVNIDGRDEYCFEEVSDGEVVAGNFNNDEEDIDCDYLTFTLEKDFISCDGDNYEYVENTICLNH